MHQWCARLEEENVVLRAKVRTCGPKLRAAIGMLRDIEKLNVSAALAVLEKDL